MGDARRLQRKHGLDPTHRRSSLAHQRILDRLWIGQLSHVHIVDHGNPRRHQRQFLQAHLERLRCRLHQCAMERRRYWQHQGTLSALGFNQFGGTLDRCFVAGDHGLLRFVEIHRLHHLSLRGFDTGLNHGSCVETHDCGHGSLAGGNRGLHRLGP